MDNWQITKLKEVCEKVTVGFVGSMAHEYRQNGIPFLRSQNITPYRINLNNLKYIDDKFHGKIRKSALHPGDVAIVRTGYPGTACVIPLELSISNCSDLVIVRPGSQLNPHFLCAIFNSTFGRDLVGGNLVGAAQQHFNITVAKELKFRLPPRQTQDKIASILSAYDDLIENNQRRIALLERMAEEIYREWFVRLRFPGHGQVKMVKGVPEGWELVKLEKAFTFTGGGTPSKEISRYWEDGTINWYTPSDITAAGGIFLDHSGSQCTEEGLRNSSARLFPAHSIMMTSRATIGAIGINTTPACTNQGFITCIPNSRYPLTFLYHWLKLAKPHFEILSGGATFAELTKGTFKKIAILTPPKEIISRFEERVLPLFKQIEALLKATGNLTKTRELLLPRLISGRLPVKALDIRFPPSMAETVREA
jgi:type I restriction enzyme S subunit